MSAPTTRPAEFTPARQDGDPGAATAPESTVRRAAALFTPSPGQLVMIALAILVSSALGVVQPYLIQPVFDDALFVAGGPDLELLYILVSAMIVLPLLAALIGVYQTYLTTVLGNRVMRDLRDRLFAHLQSMELGFFTATRTGAIQSRLANDVGGVQGVVTDTVSSILANGVTVIATFVAMLLLSWELTVVSVALLPVFILLQSRVGAIRRRIAARTQSSLSEMTAITQESLSVSGILLSKVFNRQRFETARYREENRQQSELQVRQTMSGQSFFALVQSFFGITPALVYLVAGIGLAAGFFTVSAGTIVAFTALQSRLLFPILTLMRVTLEVQTSLALFSRIFEYLDLKPAIVDAPSAVDLRRNEAAGAVELRDVWFRYPAPPANLDGGSPNSSPTQEAGDAPRERAWALREVSLRIAPGQLAAVVGPSGAGKTTLSYLVPRLYDVDSGQVLLDGHDVRDLTQESVADLVGMVTQDTYLFHATIADNLRYAAPGVREEQVIAASLAANIHDRIMSFDDGYDTMVGERGYRLSGGEKQRLAIARVILSDPKILILDEATSALDTTSERLVQRALETVMAGRTTIAIAHRLSTILAADVIFAVDDGQIVERGTHAELLDAGGLYARLYAEQFAGGQVQARCHDGVVFRDGYVMST